MFLHSINTSESLLQCSENHCSSYYTVFNSALTAAEIVAVLTVTQPDLSHRIYFGAHVKDGIRCHQTAKLFPLIIIILLLWLCRTPLVTFCARYMKFFFFLKRVLHREAPSNNNYGPFYGYMKREWHYRPISCRSKTNCTGWTLRDQIEACLEKYLQLSSCSSCSS